MTDAKFNVSVDGPRGLMEITLNGQWTLSTIADFRVALADAYSVLAAAGYPAGSFYVLSNSQMHGVQSKEITTGLEELAQEFATMSRKTAVIVSGMLHKMQVERVSASDKIRPFTDHDEATAWLYA